MTTPIQQKIRDKKRTPAQIVDMIRPGDWINPGTVGGDSTAIMDELASRLATGSENLKQIELWGYALAFPHGKFQKADPKEENHCFHDYFFFQWNRKARDKNMVTSWSHWGWALGMWYHHYRFAHNEKSKRGIDWWFNAVSPPVNGYYNFSYGTNNAVMYADTAKRCVLEVRSDYPWAEGGQFNTIHIDDIDYWIEVDCEKYKWPQINEKAIQPTPEEKKIAEHCLKIMRDRDVVQLGIGSLPSAVVASMADAGLKDLGIHTEMLNYGLITLMESGKVTNKYKTIDRNKSVWTFAFPVDVKWYYDAIHRNPQFAVYDIDYVNNIYQISRIDNMIAINNAVAIDLYGQVCAGHYEKRPISGSGGFFNFICFCSLARGGRSIVTMTSRTKEGKSRILPFLPPGSSVDAPAQLVNYVCTEYGIVNLRGLNGYEKTEALISIAHPDDRDNLEKEAREHGLLAPKFDVPMMPIEGKTRRYPSYDERRDYKIPYTSRIWGHNWNPFISGK